ncbi:hypothetical protein CI109_103669 [Kwoniella shandongensis]|uniref:Polysaccharide lyase 14 domain-containing protein n=1 Tax=Kwoniella shandongensis TaxID=1734106 RepID=A0A5M6CCB5_9TREE|nr:uncharacterized protein CI109_000637 [Kwoniella shandongensis]KAA5531065.1 hypothetical protein CI109_000637 [Kwoniella shandongensis]
MSPTILLALAALLSIAPSPSRAVSLDSIISSYGLTDASYNFSWPDETLNSADANSWILKNWNLNSKKVDFGNPNIVFSPDPSTSSSTVVRRAASTKSSTSTSSASTTFSTSYPSSTNLAGQPPALRIEYPQGSYSKKTGGTQFYASPLNTTQAKVDTSVLGNATTDGQYERMLLSYDIWFPSGFAWNMGGKLPGLRGGPDARGCSGGNETDGSSCFSTRMMWRSGGAGEVYAYIPTSQKGFCSQSEVTCNSDYGTSLARGSFSFVTGQWQTIHMLVVLNEVGKANGIVQLWYNGVQALSFQNLVLRKSSALASVGGLYFSTFFGGDDSSWASPTDQFTYFRNIQLYAGAGASNLTGAAVSGASRSAVSGSSGVWGVVMGLVVLGMMGMGVL